MPPYDLHDGHLNAQRVHLLRDVLCVGPHQQHDLELVEKYYDTPSKRKPAIGYDLLDRSIKNYQKQNLGQRKPGEKPLLLIGPSWQYDNLMDSCLDGLLEQLMGAAGALWSAHTQSI